MCRLSYVLAVQIEASGRSFVKSTVMKHKSSQISSLMTVIISQMYSPSMQVTDVCVRRSVSRPAHLSGVSKFVGLCKVVGLGKFVVVGEFVGPCQFVGLYKVVDLCKIVGPCEFVGLCKVEANL